MLEKDMENLIAKYPQEFFPKSDFKIVGQQIKLGTFFADIIFEDKTGKKSIIEVKRGVLSRDAVGQIIDYYGEIKLKKPDTEISLILVANVIPKQRIIFLAEKLDIVFRELSVSHINQVAQKYGYRFLDSDDIITINNEEKTNFFEQPDNYSNDRRVWIFQANPERFDILNAMSDPELDEDVWLVNKYKNEIRAGDTGLIWISGKDGGIYAVIDIISKPEYLKEKEVSAKYWLDNEDANVERLRIKYRYKIKLKNNPILREEIKNQPELKNLSILKLPRGTNFPVSKEEWNCILRLIKTRFLTVEEN